MSYNPYDPESKYIPILNPVGAAIIGLVFVFFTYQIVGGLITLAIFGFDLNTAPTNGFRIMTTIGQFIFILVPTLVLSQAIYRDIPNILRFKMPRLLEVLVFAGGMAILIPLMQELIAVQNYVLEYLASASSVFNSFKAVFDQLNTSLEGTYLRLISAANIFELSWVIFVIAVTPAICEELLFRGFIQHSLEFSTKPKWAIILTGVFFGLYHFSPYGLMALVIFGVYIGFTAYKSESIVIPMILHFINNFVTVVVFYIIGDTELLDASAVPPGDILYSVINVVLLSLFFIFFLYIVNKNYHKLKGGSDDLS